MSDIDTIRSEHEDWCAEHRTYTATAYTDLREQMAVLLAALDEWRHELSNLALDRERERDAARADAERLAEALHVMHLRYWPTGHDGLLSVPCDACAALAAHEEAVK
jgi:hypothetical protein